MEPEKITQPQNKRRPKEETQVEEQQVGTQETAKCIEPLRVEAHIDEFDFHTKYNRYRENPHLLLEHLRHEAKRCGVRIEDLMLDILVGGIIIRRLRKPGRKISPKLFIEDEDISYILNILALLF